MFLIFKMVCGRSEAQIRLIIINGWRQTWFFGATFLIDFGGALGSAGRLRSGWGRNSRNLVAFWPLGPRAWTCPYEKLFICHVLGFQNGLRSLGFQICPHRYKWMKPKKIGSRTFSKDFGRSLESAGRLGASWGWNPRKLNIFLPPRSGSQTAHAKKLFIFRVFDFRKGLRSLGGQTWPNHYKQMKANVIIWSHIFIWF